MITSVLAVVFTFGVIIFIHEFGHFLVCKLVGICVENFSFGFGKELWGFSLSETRYSLRLVPLGGYVKPKGEDIEDHKGEPDEYFSKSWYVRLAVVWAGPVMNYILAFIVFFLVIATVGKPVITDKPIIGSVAQGYPAEKAGLKEGDRILSINGINVKTWTAMSSFIHSSPLKEISMEYEREGNTYKLKLTPVKAVGDSKKAVVGIAPATEYVPVSFFKSATIAAHQCWYWTAFTVKSLAKSIYRMEKPDLSGPIGIVTIVSKAARTGPSDFFFLLGLISVAVGFFNLLPIPLLDGGHSILYIFEGLTRKRLTAKIMQHANSVGIAILLGIFIFATYNDIKRIYDSHFVKREVASTFVGR